MVASYQLDFRGTWGVWIIVDRKLVLRACLIFSPTCSVQISNQNSIVHHKLNAKGRLWMFWLFKHALSLWPIDLIISWADTVGDWGVLIWAFKKSFINFYLHINQQCYCYIDCQLYDASISSTKTKNYVILFWLLNFRL